MNNVVGRHANDDDSVASRAIDNKIDAASAKASQVARPPNPNPATGTATDPMGMRDCWTISNNLGTSFFPAPPSSAFTPCPSFLLWMRPDLRVVVVSDDENSGGGDAAVGAKTAVLAPARPLPPRMATVASRPVARVGKKCGKQRRGSRGGGCRRNIGRGGGGCGCRCQEWLVRVVWLDGDGEGEGGGESEWVRCARCFPAPAGAAPEVIASSEQRQRRQIGREHQEHQRVEHRLHWEGKNEEEGWGKIRNYACEEVEFRGGGNEDGDGGGGSKRRRNGKKDRVLSPKRPRTCSGSGDAGGRCPDVTARPTLEPREDNDVDVEIVSAKEQGTKTVLATIIGDDGGEEGERGGIVTVVTNEVSEEEDHPPCHTTPTTGVVASTATPATTASKPPQPRPQKTIKIGGVGMDALTGGPAPTFSSSLQISRIVTPPGGDDNDSIVADVAMDANETEDELESDVDYNDIFEEWSGNSDHTVERDQDSSQDRQHGRGQRRDSEHEIYSHGAGVEEMEMEKRVQSQEEHRDKEDQKDDEEEHKEGGGFNFLMDMEDSPVPPPPPQSPAREGDDAACVTPRTALGEVSDEDAGNDAPLETASPADDAGGPPKIAKEKGGGGGRGSDPDRTTPPDEAATGAGGATLLAQSTVPKTTNVPTQFIAVASDAGGGEAAPPVWVSSPSTNSAATGEEGDMPVPTPGDEVDATASVADTVAAKVPDDEIASSPPSRRSSKWTCLDPSCGRRNKRSRKRCKRCKGRRTPKVGGGKRTTTDRTTSKKEGDDDGGGSLAARTGGGDKGGAVSPRKEKGKRNVAPSLSSLAAVVAKKKRRRIYSGFDDEDCVFDALFENAGNGHGCAAEGAGSDGRRYDDPKEEEDDRLTCFHKNMKYPVGTEVLKLFFGQPYTGIVVGYDPKVNWYKIAYDDGDQEELGEEEVSRWVVVRQNDDKGGVKTEKEDTARSRRGLRKVHAVDYHEDHAYDELSKLLDNEDVSFLKKKAPREGLESNQKSLSGDVRSEKRDTQCTIHLVALPPTARPGERLLVKLRNTDGCSADEDLFVTCPSGLPPKGSNKPRMIRVICPKCSTPKSCWPLGGPSATLSPPSGVQESNLVASTTDGKRPHLFMLHSVRSSAVMQIADLLPPSFHGRQRLRTAEAVGHFFLFCHERQLIWERKNRGDDFPLTQDPLMASEHFCNVYRELDRGTVYFRSGQGLRAIWARENEKVVGKGPRAERIELLAQTLWASLCYRLVNKVQTFERFGGIPTMDEWPEFVKEMKKLRASGFVLFTGAHQVMGWDRYVRTMEASLMFDAARIRTLANIAYGATKIRDLQRIFDALVNLENVGRFFAWQVICDLLEANVLDPCTENDWVELGPGARAGMKQIFADGADRGKLSLAKFLRENQDGVFAALGVEFPFLNGVKLTLKSIEHALCEYDKYERMRTGKNRRKRFYRHSQTKAGM